jgi:hypothetical protein
VPLKVNTIVGDKAIKWIAYTKEEIICKRFPLDQWHLAIHDIDSDKEWASFLSESTFVKCYILKLCSNNKSIAFAYTIQEDVYGKDVSIHGGGWDNNLMYYRGFVLMVKYLLEQGLKIRTCCRLSNPRAIRFTRSVGFIPYRYTADEVFMWINEKKLKSSKIYKRIYQ